MARFQDLVKQAFGDSVTSGYRSQEEQDSLVARGVTRAKTSTHTTGGGVDFRANTFKDEASLRAEFKRRGLPEPTRVIYERGGKNQGTGPHWHVENAPMAGNRKGGTDQPVRMVDIPPSNRNSVTNTGQADPEQVVNPFTIGSKLRDQIGNMTNLTSEQVQQNSQMQAEQQQIQQEREAGLQSANQQRKLVLANMAANTEKMRAAAQPIFQRQLEVTNRLAELNDTNPLEKGIRGIFDLNYNERYLSEQNAIFSEELRKLGSTYQATMAADIQAADLISEGFRMEDSERELHLQGLTQKAAILGQGFALQTQSLGLLNTALDAENGRISSINQQVQFITQNMEGPEAQRLADIARNNPGGITQVNGVPISAAQLQRVADNYTQHQLSLESLSMSIQLGRQEFQQKLMDNVVETMTEPQLDAAISQNGLIRGPDGTAIQLDPLKLNQRKAGFMQVRETGAMADVIANAPVAVREMTRQMEQRHLITRNRATELNSGNIPPELERQFQANAVELKEIARLQNEGNANGRGAEVAAQLAPRIEAMSKQTDSLVRNMSKRIGGNDEDMQEVAYQYLTGGSVNGVIAIRAFAKSAIAGSVPSLARSSPNAQAAWNTALGAVQQVNQMEQVRGTKMSAQEKLQNVTAVLQNSLAETVGRNQFELLSSRVPDLARAANHPFGRVPQQEYQAALINAQDRAIGNAARQFGLERESVLQLSQGGAARAAVMNAAGIKDKVDKAQYAGQTGVNAVDAFLAQNQGKLLLEFLDSTSARTNDFRPSQAYVSFMNSPEVLNAANNINKASQMSSFGDFLIGGAAEGAVATATKNFGQDIKTAQAIRKSEQQSRIHDSWMDFNQDPVKRMQVLFSGRENFTPQQEQTLLQGLIAKVGPFKRDPVSAVNSITGLADDSAAMLYSNQLENALLTPGTFRDQPDLEKLRASMAKDWELYTKQNTSTIGRFLRGFGINTDLGNPNLRK